MQLTEKTMLVGDAYNHIIQSVILSSFTGNFCVAASADSASDAVGT